MNINNLNYRPPTSCSELNKQERTTGIPMEDWLRGCVYHDGRFGEVTLPIDKVIEIANYIQATRTGIDGDGMVYFPSNEEIRTMTKQEAIEIICDDYCKFPDIESGNRLADICDSCPFNKCEDLRWADRKTEQTERSRTMTKERAIELLKNFNQYDEPNCMGYWDCDECVEALYMGIEAIKEQPKRGKWIDREEVQGYIKVKHRICSVCYREPSAWSSRKKFKYCPNCGARMESDER